MEFRDNKLKENFDLVKKIIKQNKSLINSEQLNNIERIIDKDLPNTIKKTAPVNFPDIYFDFKYEYDKFKEFILYNQLIGKNIVALGGGFSSGKSSFLNSSSEFTALLEMHNFFNKSVTLEPVVLCGTTQNFLLNIMEKTVA